MENYQAFLDRINSFEWKKWCFAPGDFKGNPSLVKKVQPDNSFRPFYGDTVVFNLNDSIKEQLAKWLEKLYAEVPECFCERLVNRTFHMTLHDLSNSEVLSDIVEDVARNKEKIQELRKDIKSCDTIKMRTKCIFNMVNTSLVLGLYPANAEEHEKLVNLYEVFNGVKELPYPLTPHITLAYYNVHGFSDISARKLEELVYQLNSVELETEIEVVLEAKELYYQQFESMNQYRNIFSVLEV